MEGLFVMLETAQRFAAAMPHKYALAMYIDVQYTGPPQLLPHTFIPGMASGDKCKSTAPEDSCCQITAADICHWSQHDGNTTANKLCESSMHHI